MSFQLHCSFCNITIPEAHGVHHLNGQEHAANASHAVTRTHKISRASRALGVPMLRVYSYREYTNFLPLYVWKEAEVEKALSSLMAYRMGGPLGFDLEWESEGGVPRRVALVQLSTVHVVVLIQVSAMRVFPARLLEILGNPHILKLGVGVLDDAKRLYQDYGVCSNNLIDLCHYARSTDPDFLARNGKRQVGLAEIVARYLYRALEKGPVRMSHWEDRLSFEQAEYAANDAHSAVQAFHAMQARLNYQTIKSLNATNFTYNWDSARPASAKKAASVPVMRSGVLVAAATAWTCYSCGVTMALESKNEHLVGPDHLAHLVRKGMSL
ncbi:unnamed protein product [Peniophora sp. CBMAI 1063]|nr:unnamed protein product [Peniophora sp. CBMAI 1063]